MSDNQLDLDDDAVKAEIPPAPPGAAPQPGAAPGAQAPGAAPAQAPAEGRAAWLSVAELGANMLHGLLAPNWKFSPPQSSDLVEAIADVLNDLMPGGIANIGNWGPYGRLAFAAAAVALANFDPKTATLRPMRAPERPKRAGNATGAAPSTPHNQNADQGDPDIVLKGERPVPTDD